MNETLPKGRYDSQVQTQNEFGEWVPAIPEPFFLAFGRARCVCGDKFKTRAAYRGHYALEHVMGLKSE